MGETDLESQTSAQKCSTVRSSSYPTIDYDERSFEPPNNGRQYEKYRESSIEPFSSYRNSTSVPQPIDDDYPNELCQNLNCWQTAPHQHTIEELQYLMEKTRSRSEHDRSKNETKVQKQRQARKIAKPTTRLRSSRGLNSLLDDPARMIRDLKRSLPDTSGIATQVAKDQSHRAQLPNHISSNRASTLALRPIPSRQSLIEADEVEVAEPV